MTVVARTFCSIPKRSALETWAAIAALLAPKAGSEARRELESVAEIASSLITREAMNSPIVVYTDGDWHMSLPCPADDLDWIVGALAKKTKRITARDQGEAVESEESSQASKAAGNGGTASIDMEAFLKP